MDEYIDRELLKVRFCNECIIKGCLYKLIGGNAHKCIDIQTIDDIPAADVRPVVRGENIATDCDDCDQFVCSKCGIELQGWYRVERDEDYGDETHHEYVFLFCPNCGADIMRKEK